jgi:hypothetical protein
MSGDFRSRLKAPLLRTNSDVERSSTQKNKLSSSLDLGARLSRTLGLSSASRQDGLEKRESKSLLKSPRTAPASKSTTSPKKTKDVDAKPLPPSPPLQPSDPTSRPRPALIRLRPSHQHSHSLPERSPLSAPPESSSRFGWQGSGGVELKTTAVDNLDADFDMDQLVNKLRDGGDESKQTSIREAKDTGSALERIRQRMEATKSEIYIGKGDPNTVRAALLNAGVALPNEGQSSSLPSSLEPVAVSSIAFRRQDATPGSTMDVALSTEKEGVGAHGEEKRGSAEDDVTRRRSTVDETSLLTERRTSDALDDKYFSANSPTEDGDHPYDDDTLGQSPVMRERHVPDMQINERTSTSATSPHSHRRSLTLDSLISPRLMACDTAQTTPYTNERVAALLSRVTDMPSRQRTEESGWASARSGLWARSSVLVQPRPEDDTDTDNNDAVDHILRELDSEEKRDAEEDAATISTADTITVQDEYRRRAAVQDSLNVLNGYRTHLGVQRTSLDAARRRSPLLSTTAGSIADRGSPFSERARSTVPSQRAPSYDGALSSRLSASAGLDTGLLRRSIPTAPRHRRDASTSTTSSRVVSQRLWRVDRSGSYDQEDAHSHGSSSRRSRASDDDVGQRCSDNASATSAATDASEAAIHTRAQRLLLRAQQSFCATLPSSPYASTTDTFGVTASLASPRAGPTDGLQSPSAPSVASRLAEVVENAIRVDRTLRQLALDRQQGVYDGEAEEAVGDLWRDSEQVIRGLTDVLLGLTIPQHTHLLGLPPRSTNSTPAIQDYGVSLRSASATPNQLGLRTSASRRSSISSRPSPLQLPEQLSRPASISYQHDDTDDVLARNFFRDRDAMTDFGESPRQSFIGNATRRSRLYGGPSPNTQKLSMMGTSSSLPNPSLTDSLSLRHARLSSLNDRKFL